jgi:hypothetical protein
MTLRGMIHFLYRHKFILFLVVLATSWMFYAHTHAYWGDRDWKGYFYQNQETSGLPVINGGVPDSVNSASEYVSYVKGLYNSSDVQKHTAGAYIILVMMGYAPPISKSKVDDTVTIHGRTDTVMNIWSDMIMQFGQQHLIDYHWTTPSTFSCQNTFYQPTYHDVADYDDCAGTRGQDSIAFFHPEDPSKPVFVLKRACGNPIGKQGGVPIPNQTPLGSIAVCINGAAKTYSIRGWDPDHPNAAVDFMVVHYSNNTKDFDGSTTQNSPTTGTYPAFYPGRPYRLMVKDLDDDDFYDIDPVVTYPVNCGAQPADGTCSAFHYNMAAHSIYRFDFLSVDNIPTVNPPFSQGSGNHSYPGNPTAAWASPAFPGNSPTSTQYRETSDSTGSFNFTFPPPINSGWFTYVSHWQHESNGTWTYTHDSDWQANCYSARITDDSGACTISIDSNIPNTGDGVLGGSTFTAHAVITNTGRANLPSNFGGYNLTITGNGDFPIETSRPTPLTNVGTTIGRGISYPVDFTLSAPADIGNYNLSGYPDYWGRGALGGSCGFNVAVYQHFSVSLRTDTSMDPSTENPSSVTYHSWLRHESGPSANVLVNSSTGQRQGGAVCDSVSNSYVTSNAPPGHEDDVINRGCAPDAVAAGATYCTDLSAAYTAGFVGPGGVGNVVPDNGSSQASPSCKTIHNEPYIQVFGADASAGGGFGSQCVSTKGGIYTYYNSGATPPSGSGVQIGALAIGPINGFSSALLRGSAPTGPSGAAFANSQPTETGNSGFVGGSMGGSRCIRDYFASKPADTSVDVTNATSLNLSPPSGFPTPYKYTKYYKPNGGTTGTLTINGGTISNNVDAAIYVEGNVYISSNITFAQSDWGSIESIPSLYIIVKGGDIRIAPGVTRLDGLYIAQPKSGGGGSVGAGGNIFSCADSGPITADLLASCRSQLVVNGAFVAQKVHLLRSFGSLRDSYPGEHIGGSRPIDHQVCSDSGAVPLATNSCAAEIFNFGPEMYLSHPAVTPSSGPTKGTYDYATSLSPIF